MHLSAGTRFGPYEIVSLLGAGGMGEVYRARDLRLGRDVALKFLPAEFANDQDRLARFEREAKVLASLNHPNIAQVYGIEEVTSDTGATRALVMEIVEGEDLSARLRRGPIPVDEAIPIGRQIAEALEAAHEHGIVHRDLKPANIKLRSDDTVKVLDFGLAKAVDPAGSGERHASDTLANSPTITSPSLTMRGIVLGTAAYMAPEQAKGKPADKRVDVWAFGCVLFEMLTAQRAFPGEDATDTIAAVIARDPDWSALPAGTPPAVIRLVRRCLVKDRRHRLPDIGVARLDLDDAATVREADVSTARAKPAHARTVLAALALVVIGLSAGLALTTLRSREPAQPAPSYRFQIPAPTDGPGYAQLSPDGTRLAVVNTTLRAGETRLWVRELDSLEYTQVTGVSVNAQSLPFWSPDGRQLAYWDNSDRKLKRIDLRGSLPQTICDAPTYAGGAWGTDGTIVFGMRGTGLFRVPPGSNTPVPITRVSADEIGHIVPQIVDGGSQILYHAVSKNGERRSVLIKPVAGGAPTQLLDSVSALGDTSGARFVADSVEGRTGFLVFIRDTQLIARRLDLENPQEPAAETPLAGGVSSFSVSDNGMLLYWLNAANLTRLVWKDRSGATLGQLGPPAGYMDLNLSPNGRHAVVSLRQDNSGPFDLWLIDLARGVPTRLTLEPSDDRFSTWSADGSWLAYASGEGRAHSMIYKKRVTGTAERELLVDRGTDYQAFSVSPDGKTLLFRDRDSNGRSNLFSLPLDSTDGPAKPVPYLAAPYEETQGRFAPLSGTQSRWVAHVSGESGRSEIYIQSFPVGTAKIQVSNGGGTQPRWRSDARELYYVSRDAKLTAVTVSWSPTLDVGLPTPLFEMAGTYDVAPDGRFLVNVPMETTGSGAAPPITVVTNWRGSISR